MKTIYPFSPYKAPTWRNWSNYLFWLDNSINSLEDYLNYFNPNFFILNEAVSYNPSNTWKEETYNIADTSKCWYLFGTTNKPMYFCLPGNLKWRQGIVNPNVKAYACLDTSCFTETPTQNNAVTLEEPTEEKHFYTLKNVIFAENATLEEMNKTINEEINKLISAGKLYEIPQSTVMFAKKWVHQGLLQVNNEETKNINHYQFMALPIAALYLPNSIANGLRFQYIKNGQSVLGENIGFTLEFAPGRYFHTNVENSSKWSNGTLYTTQGANWKNSSATMSKIIENCDGQVWTNSYPLMHECLIYDTSYSDYPTEEFIFDQEFSTENVNIANHATVLYNINAKNINSNETANWNEFVRVFIL